eukprot:8290519-Pyramimonas_sp.AAC.1
MENVDQPVLNDPHVVNGSTVNSRNRNHAKVSHTQTPHDSISRQLLVRPVQMHHAAGVLRKTFLHPP